MPPPQAHVAAPLPSPRLELLESRAENRYSRPALSKQAAPAATPSSQRCQLPAMTRALNAHTPATRATNTPAVLRRGRALLGSRHPQVRAAPWLAPGATAVMGRPGPAAAGQSRSQRPRRAAGGRRAQGEAGGGGAGGGGGAEAAGDDAGDSWAPQGRRFVPGTGPPPPHPRGSSMYYTAPRLCCEGWVLRGSLGGRASSTSTVPAPAPRPGRPRPRRSPPAAPGGAPAPRAPRPAPACALPGQLRCPRRRQGRLHHPARPSGHARNCLGTRRCRSDAPRWRHGRRGCAQPAVPAAWTGGPRPRMHARHVWAGRPGERGQALQARCGGALQAVPSATFRGWKALQVRRPVQAKRIWRPAIAGSLLPDTAVAWQPRECGGTAGRVRAAQLGLLARWAGDPGSSWICA